MSATRGLSSRRAGQWRGSRRAQLIAGGLGVLPLYWALIALQICGGQAVSWEGFTLYLAVISPLSVVVALLLLHFLCGESPRQLNLRAGRVSSDVLATLTLSVVIVVVSIISTDLLSRLMPGSGSNPSVRNLFVKLAGDPKLFGLFVGPLLFLGAASEEVVRAFLLSRLWTVWPSTAGKSAAVIVSACLFGLIHLYQGSVHAVWTGILGLIMALYYVRYGRVAPLILAHYLTNALQVAVFAARGG
jgi:membrane protease YdiL (CAAX protease family)